VVAHRIATPQNATPKCRNVDPGHRRNQRTRRLGGTHYRVLCGHGTENPKIARQITLGQGGDYTPRAGINDPHARFTYEQGLPYPTVLNTITPRTHVNQEVRSEPTRIKTPGWVLPLKSS